MNTIPDRTCEGCYDAFTPHHAGQFICDACEEDAMALDEDHKSYGDFAYSMNG